MIVDDDGMLEVTEVVPSTTDEDYLPRTRAQSCFMVRSPPLDSESSWLTAYTDFQTAGPDSELEAEERQFAEAHCTTSESPEQSPGISVKHEPTDGGVELQPAKRKRAVLDEVVPMLASFPPTKPKVITKEEKEKQMKKIQNVCDGA